jgi:hypothetical protein
MHTTMGGPVLYFSYDVYFYAVYRSLSLSIFSLTARHRFPHSSGFSSSDFCYTVMSNGSELEVMECSMFQHV